MKEVNIREKIQSEATQSIIDNKFVGVLEMSPRTGKSKVTIDALNTVEKEINVLIIAPRKEIFESWKKEFSIWKLRDNIKVDFLWSNSIKKNKKTYHLIVCDEVHSYNLKVIALLGKEQHKGSRILALTGTLDGNTQFLLENSLRLSVLYSYSVRQAIEDNIIADYEIRCIGCHLDNTDKYVLAGNEEKPFYQTELEAYTYWNNRYEVVKKQQKWSQLRFPMSKRLNVIYNSKTKYEVTKQIVDSVDRCIIFSGRQEIADKLGEASFHSKSDKSTINQFKHGVINKLSVVSMVSMGITIPNLKIAIFNQLKSDENMAIQQTMRAMNLEGGRKATIYIVYLLGTQDVIWLQSALQGFDKSKIKFETHLIT